MQKKKNVRCEGGRSVLHIKNSSGGFCKVKKTGRLGKNCIYFCGSGKCKKYDKWCRSLNCPGYEKRKQWFRGTKLIVAYYATSSISTEDIM